MYMSFLFTTWLISLFLLLVIFFIALYRTQVKKIKVDTGGVLSLREFIIEAIQDLIGHFSYVAVSARPHAEKVTLFFLSYGKRGHEVFSERVFGRAQNEKGRNTSFFFKHIAEDKVKNKKVQSEIEQY